MSKQESFKRRIRTRMANTGERYSTARSVLLEKNEAAHSRRRTWVAEPEYSDESVRVGTGKGWEEWCDIIDAWPDRTDDHAPIAAFVHNEHGVDMWWAQTVTVGYERITGLRLPYQRADGTFTASKSQTVNLGASATDHETLRELLLDARARTDLFPGHETDLLSRPTAKAIRIAIGPGVAKIGIGALADGRVKITVAHEQLPTYESVEEWKFYWTEWLDALDQS